ncbi:hypothetical protein JOF29_003555 [Kribbella aluminosa]|uniref:Secreted protein with PEP-CTERM sorting signal n=1 Tax=Kribbella aluminosa TaxID=416017 RepID=A0ABS4ULF9_9ACTN|nr:hypothetical protein [Kribbella aluminosa]
MSEYKEYKDKAAGKNHKGNTDHRKTSSCMVAAPVPIVVIGTIGLLAVRVARRLRS